MLGGNFSKMLSDVVTHPCVGMIVSSASREDAQRAHGKAVELFSWWSEGKSPEWMEGVSLVTEVYLSPTVGYSSFAILTGGMTGPKKTGEGAAFASRYKQAEKDFIIYMQEINKELDNWGPLTWYQVLPGPECSWYGEV